MPIGSAGAPAPERRGQGAGAGRRSAREGDAPPPPPTLAEQLTQAQSNLANKQRERLDLEVKNLTVRYGGDEALARKIAQDRAGRNFAASSPDFAAEIAPLQAKVADLEEQIRKTAQRRRGGTLGAGGGSETLGG